MSIVVSKAGIHCVGSKRDGYGPFLQRINEAGRRLSLIKCRDDFGAIDEPLILWPDIVTIGARTEWDDADYNVDTAYTRIVEAARLNPKIKYWEYFNERNGDYTQQANLNIALLPRLAQVGIGLCMWNCASGTPQYPGWTAGLRRVLHRITSLPIEEPYDAIARTCQFAKANGYKAILGLHEYDHGPGTIGRFATLRDYLQARGVLLPMAITEYGQETFPGISPFMAMVITNDPLYMRDPNMIGCSVWTLGGAGWAGSNFSTALPQLGDYIATVNAPPVPPADEYEFDYWDVDGQRVDGNPITLTMNGPHTVTPHARKKAVPPPPPPPPPPIEIHELTINACPEYPGLSVVVNPPGLAYAAGTIVTCEAVL